MGRGVLLDYLSWAERKGRPVNPMSKHRITVSDLLAIAEEEGVTFAPGDILIVRTGWIKWYEEHGEEDRQKYITNGTAWIGVEGCPETLEWLWNQRFAAVAGDSIGWEVWPPTPGYRESSVRIFFRNSHLISLQTFTTIFSRCGGCPSVRCGIWRHWQGNVKDRTGGPSSSPVHL